MNHASERPAIIGFDFNPWHGPWMNRQELLSRLGERGWTVVYSNGALAVWNRRGERWHSADLMGRFYKSDNVVVDCPGRLCVRWPGHSWWDTPMLKVHALRLCRAVGRKPGDPLIVQLFAPGFFEYVKVLKPTHLAFHIRDYYPGVPGWSATQQWQLDELAERANLITLAGPEMISCLPKSAQHKARPLYNAGNPQSYITATSKPCPGDLDHIPRPRIGYIGNINGKCDFTTVIRVARMRPQWQWVFVGDVVLPRLQEQELWRSCLQCPNVHWLGARDHLEIPGYVAHMDVNALVFLTGGENTEWVPYTNPLRINGCLASGNPVVGADIPAIRRYRPLVDTATTTDEWILALERAIDSPGNGMSALRQARASELSWDRQADQLDNWLREMIGDHVRDGPSKKHSAVSRATETQGVSVAGIENDQMLPAIPKSTSRGKLSEV